MEAIVNWIWQGMALTAVSTVALDRSRRLSATTRYLIWWMTLVLVLALPLAPRFAGWLAPAVAPAGVTTLTPVPLPELPAWPLTAAFVCWFGWVVIALTRVTLSVVGLVVARRRVTPFPAGREAALTHWAAVRAQGRPARLAICGRVPAAAVFGLGPAIIAVSPDVYARLTDEELDQVILHEWAHVQRRDDFGRLIQIVVRVIAGLHPAVWWIGRRLEIERETACDDFAVNVTGAARRMARCLTKLAEAQPRPMRTVLAPGVLASSQLATRVQRLLDPERNTSTARARGVLGPIAAALVTLAASLSQVELVAAASSLPPVQERPAVAAPAVAPATPSGKGVKGAAPSAARDPEPIPDTLSPGASAVRDTSNDAVAKKAPRAGSGPDPISTGEIPALERTEWMGPALPPVSAASRPDARPGGSEPSSGEAPWDAAADAGVAIGHGSQKAGTATADAAVSIGQSSTKAAVATAGFFSRLGRKVGGSF